MYLHLGQGCIVRTDEVIGIFDLDNATVSKRTRDYLNKAENNGQVITVGYELPKSFVVCGEKNGDKKIYLSPLSTVTLLGREMNNFLRKPFF